MCHVQDLFSKNPLKFVFGQIIVLEGKKWGQTLTEAEQNRLVIEHMNDLVPAIAAEFRGGDIEFDDLLQFGREGLIKAAQSFNPTKSQFSSWATNKIKLEIFNAVEAAKVQWYPKETDTVPLPSGGHSIEKIYDWDAWGERGNAEAICERWSILDASPEELSIRYQDIKDKQAKFQAAFISLTGAQRKLVTWVHLEAMPIADAARELGVSYFKAIRILKKALNTMREVITSMETKTDSAGNTAKEHPPINGPHGCAPGIVAA